MFCLSKKGKKGEKKQRYVKFHLPTYLSKTHLPLTSFLHLPNRKFEHTVRD